MSFVIATPELMQEAAQDLAGIHSSLAEATPGSIDLSGTTFGGFLPGLLTFLPEQLAEVIGAPIPVAPVSM